MLFGLYEKGLNGRNFLGENKNIGLFSFYCKNPEELPMFKKPFRVLAANFEAPQFEANISVNKGSKTTVSHRYLLIHYITDKEAIVMDIEGKKRKVTIEFLKNHWGQEVSWVYPYETRKNEVIKGKSGRNVLELQQALKNAGYYVEVSGIYDELTLRAVKKFQEYVGLKPDGIVGPRTRALLYQMSD